MANVDLKTKNSIKSVFYFKGIFSDYLDELQQVTSVHPKLFDEIYKAYVFCVYYGLMKGKMHKYDPDKDVASNPDRQLIGFRYEATNRAGGIYKYDTLRKIVILFDKSKKKSFSEKIDDALRFDYSTNNVDDEDLIKKSLYGENTDLLEQYCLGGLELFYSKVSSISTPEAMMEFMDEVKEEFQELISSL